jgi:glycine/D-amino acid oxidase-like deaminating enzyme
MRAKTVVIGGGVIGCAVALKVARRSDPLREPVVLLEKSDLGAGSTGRSGAILRQLYSDPRIALMARDSLRAYAGFEGLTARAIGFRRSGLLSIAGQKRPEWVERLRDAHARLVDAGINVHLVGPAEMHSLIPGLRVDDGSVGVWEPDAGFVDPRRTVEAFAALARTYGAITRLGVEVQELRVEAGRVTGVVANGEAIEAEHVIVCAGPWSRRLLATAGWELPLRVVRPENHFLRLPVSYHETMPDAEGVHTLGGVDLEDPLEAISEQISGQGSVEEARIHPVIVDLESSFYARCDPAAHRTRVGRADHDHDRVLDDPDELDEEVGPEAGAWAREALSARMPVYGREPDVASEAAWYTLTPDSMPILGPMPGVEGLYAAVGFSGHGFKLAPSVGEGFAQMLRGETVTAFDEELFAPARFAAGGKRVRSPFGL